MTLKNVRLGRAEKLSEATRKKFELPESGLVFIETLNPELKENIISAEKIGGLRGYLLSKGEFTE